MENFVVSARKYRPKCFDEVIGQEHITTTLKNAIENNHLAQALLFCGPRGVGKTTCARIVARMINNYDSGETDVSLNIFELDAASNNSVDHIRNLTDQVRYPPQFGNYKVYIIDEVHMLSNTAFNAFLKTLEEPPPYAIFILATTEKHKVIPTILSRCQIYDFNRISISDITSHLKEIAEKEGVKAEEEALHLIARKADGALRDALSLFDLIVTFSADNSITYQATIDNLHILDYDYYFKMTDYLLREDVVAGLLLYDEILKKGFDSHNFIIGLSQHFRNLMVCKDEASVKLLEVAENVKTKYNDQAKEATMSFLMSVINISSQCDIQYKASKNQRLLVELSLMKMAHISSAIKLAGHAVTDNSGDDKKKTKTDSLASKKTDSEELNKPQVTADKPEVSEPQEIYNKASVTSPDLQESDLRKLQKTTKIPSLSALKEVKEAISTDEPLVVGADSEENVETKDNSFSLTDLENSWRAFSETKKEAGKAQELNVLNQPFHFNRENTTVTITLINSIQLDILDELKSDLLLFLKEKLNNSFIKIEGDLQKEKTDNNKLYTNKEKFEYLAEKNPVVKSLQEKLGLDPDF